MKVKKMRTVELTFKNVTILKIKNASDSMTKKLWKVSRKLSRLGFNMETSKTFIALRKA